MLYQAAVLLHREVACHDAGTAGAGFLGEPVVGVGFQHDDHVPFVHQFFDHPQGVVVETDH